MSRKKEKRIKRLRRSPVFPQLIETFIVEIAFVVAIIITLVADFSSETHELLVKGSDTCNMIIECINNDWDSGTNSLGLDSQEEFLNILKYQNEAISAINIVDEDFNVLSSFGERNITESSFVKDFDNSLFEENGFYFSQENMNDEGISDGLSLEYDSKKKSRFIKFLEAVMGKKPINALLLFREHFFSSFDSFNDRKLYDWATQDERAYTMWILYKTNVPGVNVAIEKRTYRSMLAYGRFVFLVCVLVIVYLFIWGYEHYKLISIILQRRKIKKLIYTDSVTGGYNKEFFLHKAGKMIKRRHKSFVVVCIRMDKFRNYQTAYGIKAGDNLLEDFYKKLGELIKKRKEFVAHLEKGDFVLLLHFDNEELLNIRLHAITQALNDCRPNQHLFFSVGACRILSRKDNLEEKITNAGAALSKKENNTTNVLWFDEAMREEQVWERRVEDDMDKALENNEFKVYLQPKYSTKKEELSAAEALVRWIHPEYGFVSPAKFIPIFERNGFITKLDDYMLEEVSKLQASWLAQGKKLVPISVNVSRAHFSQYDLAEHICGIVDTYKVPHEFIELELTESAFFDDKQVLLNTIKKLKNYGFKVSMDDFGAGYSSLNSLKELPLDIIKLDAQFFRDIEDKKRADLIVCDTIKLAKKLGMQIVAEGIETREQVDFLAEQHCDLIQGFYFAKPLPIEEFEEKAFS